MATSPSQRRRSGTRRWQPIRILSTRGVVFFADLDRPDASLVGRHWNAVRRYLETGASDDLADFDGVEVSGVTRSGLLGHADLQTDLDEIDRLAVRGEVRFESIYDEVQ